MRRLQWSVFFILALTSCSGLPKLSLTPVDLDTNIGGQHETASSEDAIVKVQTGDSSNTKYVAEKVEQAYTNVQEYPLWLVIAFALATGLAIPSPTNAYSHWRQRRRLEKQIDMLIKNASVPGPPGATGPQGEQGQSIILDSEVYGYTNAKGEAI